MTNSGKPVLLFTSIDQVISQKMAACSDPSYAQQATLEKMFGTLNFQDVGGARAIAEALQDGTCTAAIAPRTDFDNWASQSEFCELSQVGPSLVFATAGWLTSTRAAPCVQRPLELAIHLLQASGELQEMYSDWVPVAACAEEGAEATPTRRRLGRTSESTRSHRRSHRRRLASGGAAAAAASSGGADEAQMGVKDFTGLWVLWFSGTTLALLVSAGKSVYAARVLRMRPRDSPDGAMGEQSLTKADSHGAPARVVEMTAPTLSQPASVSSASDEALDPSYKGHNRDKKQNEELDRSKHTRRDTLLDSVFGRNADTVTPHFDPNLDINNTSAMMRYLIKLADDSRQEEVRTAGKVHELWDLLVQRAPGRLEAAPPLDPQPLDDMNV